MDSKKRRQDEAPTDLPPTKSPKPNPLTDIPTTPHYTISYMHKQTVTHVATSLRHGYVLTGGSDGVVKFWKRTATKAPVAASNSGVGGLGGGSGGDKDKSSRCLEFVKSYSSHSSSILALATSQPSGDSAVSIGYDSLIKFYDVATFDVSGMIRTSHSLGRDAVLMEREDLVLLVSTRALTREEWKEKKEAGPNPDEKKVPQGAILMFSGTNLSSEPLRVITIHASPVTALAYSSDKQWVISADVGGVLEVWNVPAASSEGSSNDNGPLPFESKLDTDLYALMKKKTYAIDIAASKEHFAVYASDRKIRLFSLQNCKLVCIYDERLKVYDNLLASKSSAMGIDAIEYGKRTAVEREMEDAYLLSGGLTTNPSTKQSFSAVTPNSEGAYHQSIHLTFDNTGKYLLIPTIVGVKVINIQNHKVVATIGKSDASSLRYLYLCLCPGDAKINQQMQLARSGGSSAAISHGDSNEPNDSLLIALAYNKRRFYAFSHYDPLSNISSGNEEQIILARDILNEAPDASDLLTSHLDQSAPENALLTTATTAILRTTHGDITIKLYPKETPRTIQNFVGHAQSGYYDNVIFHRIIPGFMVQTGDPLGDGTGGESIWGGEFEDEIRRDLRHDRPFTVSMANAGPNTNGSQFFITTVPTPWLDNKHTVFGRVTGGMEVVMAIEGVKTDELDRPLSEVKILSIDVS